jgi:hypothetical protein
MVAMGLEQSSSAEILSWMFAVMLLHSSMMSLNSLMQL